MGIESYLLYTEPANLLLPVKWDTVWEDLASTSTPPASMPALIDQLKNTNMRTYGYMDWQKIKYWNHIFSTLFHTNRTVDYITFHFFCSDIAAPFVFTCKRGHVFEMWRGSSDSIHWCKKKYDTLADRLSGSYRVSFSLRRYRLNFSLDKMTRLDLPSSASQRI